MDLCYWNTIPGEKPKVTAFGLNIPSLRNGISTTFYNSDDYCYNNYTTVRRLIKDNPHKLTLNVSLGRKNEYKNMLKGDTNRWFWPTQCWTEHMTVALPSGALSIWRSFGPNPNLDPLCLFAIRELSLATLWSGKKSASSLSTPSGSNTKKE